MTENTAIESIDAIEEVAEKAIEAIEKVAEAEAAPAAEPVKLSISAARKLSDKWDIRNCVIRPEVTEVTRQSTRLADMFHTTVLKADGGCLAAFKKPALTIDRAALDVIFAAEQVKQEADEPVRSAQFCQRCVISTQMVAVKAAPKATAKAAEVAPAEAEVVDGTDLAKPFVSNEEDDAKADAEVAAAKAANEQAIAEAADLAAIEAAKAADTAKAPVVPRKRAPRKPAAKV
jgi:hypothetical protein